MNNSIKTDGDQESQELSLKTDNFETKRSNITTRRNMLTTDQNDKQENKTNQYIEDRPNQFEQEIAFQNDNRVRTEENDL